MELTDREWGEFPIGGEEGVFKISSTSSGIDKNKLNLSEYKKDIPYITRSEATNGINMFVPKSQNTKYKMDEGNVITIGLDTQTIFYQPYKFYTGQNIQVLRNERLNHLSALFIIPLLKIQMEKFNWGGNGATLGRLLRTKIMLPLDDNKQIDWIFMESYIKKQFTNKYQGYKDFINTNIKELKYKSILSLEEKKWKGFYLTELFNTIQRGKRLTKANQLKGNTPYISSTALNNGVDNFISNDKKVRRFKDCITIANSGSVGSSFYQMFEFVASDHVTHLKNENMNQYVYLFIATMLNRLGDKYNFNREINDKRISREKIILPIKDDESPDYEYMEQYIKNLMITKYKQYLM